MKRYFSLRINSYCFSLRGKTFRHHFFQLAEKVLVNIDHSFLFMEECISDCLLFKFKLTAFQL